MLSVLLVRLLKLFNFYGMNAKTKKILQEVLKALAYILTSVAATLGMASCGITRATIARPASGSSTTITITTNNPITTDVSPDVDLSGNSKH